MAKSQIQQRFLNVRQAAIYLGCSEKAIRYKIEARVLPFLRMGSSIRFDKVELNKFLAKHAVKPIELKRR